MSQMLSKLEQILNTRAGGAVERCHTIRHLGSYSNAQHQWGVAMLLWALYPADVATKLVWHALTHDVPEGLTGDVPSTAKTHETVLDDWINAEFDLPLICTLTEEEHRILRSCDILELYIWSLEQLAQGNSYAAEVTDNILMYAREKLDKPAYELFCQLGKENVVPFRAGLLKRIKLGAGL